MGLDGGARQSWRRAPLVSGESPLPQKRLTMRKLKKVLRLHSLGLSQHQIARSCSISQRTVHEYVSAAQAANAANFLKLATAIVHPFRSGKDCRLGQTARG